MFELTASIVTYKNSFKELDKAISSLLNTDLDIRLYIIDNSPTNKIKQLCIDNRVEYVYNNVNIGFAAGHNIAINKALKLGFKYHVVVNPDIYFNSGTLNKIIEYMDKNPDVGLLMPKILYPDGSMQYVCKLLPTPFDWIGRRFLPKFLIKNRNRMFELRFCKFDKVIEAPYLSGAFMFLRTKVIKEIGSFDEKIFMYGEDTDLTRRIFRKYKTVYYPYAIVYHEFHRGSKKKLKLFFIHMKAAIYYFNKWGWFYDKERRLINEITLEKLNFRKLIDS